MKDVYCMVCLVGQSIAIVLYCFVLIAVCSSEFAMYVYTFTHSNCMCSFIALSLLVPLLFRLAQYVHGMSYIHILLVLLYPHVHAHIQYIFTYVCTLHICT